MNVLVTGGCGLIGSHLSKALADMGHSVLVVDNLQTGNINNLDLEHYGASFPTKGKIDVVKWDIVDSWLHNGVMRSYKFDEVYNFACLASPVHYQNHPIQTWKTNNIGTMNMLDLAFDNGAKFVQASTSEVYGDPLQSPQKESYWGNVNCVGPRSCYDVGKRSAESLVTDYKLQYGLDVRIPRLFNTYGPGLQVGDGRVVSNFIIQALNDEPITLYGKGLQTRCFCYVTDTVHAILTLADSSHDIPCNIGSDNEITVAALAESVLHLIPSSKSKIIYEDLPVDDPKRRCPDLSIMKSLGWKPTVNLTSGLLKTIAYFERIK